MQENVTFVLPDSYEELLYALPVLAQYCEDRSVARRSIGSVTVFTKRTELSAIIKSYWPTRITTEMDDEAKASDLIIEFSPNDAYEQTKAVEKHICEAYGIQVGTVPFMTLPIVSCPIVDEEPGSILVVERNVNDETKSDWQWPQQTEFVRLATENDIDVKVLDSAASFETMRLAVAKASVVVGVRSTATLIAAAEHKIIMELAPSNWSHRNWMSKSMDRKWRMVYGTLENCTAEFVLERTVQLVEHLAERRDSMWFGNATESATDLVSSGVR